MRHGTEDRSTPVSAAVSGDEDLATVLGSLSHVDSAHAVLRTAAHALAVATGAEQVVVVPRGDLARGMSGILRLPRDSSLTGVPLREWVRRSEVLTPDPAAPALLTGDALAASPGWARYHAQPGPHLPTSGWLAVPIASTDGDSSATLTACGDLGPGDLQVALAIAAASAQALGRLYLRRMLDDALTQRQAFFGVLSHELRTPITTIYGGSRVLQQSGPRLSHDARAQLLEDIAVDAERLFRLVEDLLVLSRAEGGALEVTLEPVHLGRVIDRVTTSEQARWPRTQMVSAVDRAIPPVEAEETFVEQVLRNLLSNAAKYAGAAGPIVISAERDDRWVTVHVTDQGTGLSDADLDRVFQLFFRAPSTASSAPGAGIGLYACRELVRAMRGDLHAGRSPDGGTQFTIRLRAIDDDG